MAEKSYLIDNADGIWEKTSEGIRSILVDGEPRRGPLIVTEVIYEIEYRYGPLVPIDPADPRIPR